MESERYVFSFKDGNQEKSLLPSLIPFHIWRKEIIPHLNHGAILSLRLSCKGFLVLTEGLVKVWASLQIARCMESFLYRFKGWPTKIQGIKLSKHPSSIEDIMLVKNFHCVKIDYYNKESVSVLDGETIGFGPKWMPPDCSRKLSTKDQMNDIHMLQSDDSTGKGPIEHTVKDMSYFLSENLSSLSIRSLWINVKGEDLNHLPKSITYLDMRGIHDMCDLSFLPPKLKHLKTFGRVGFRFTKSVSEQLPRTLQTLHMTSWKSVSQEALACLPESLTNLTMSILNTSETSNNVSPMLYSLPNKNLKTMELYVPGWIREFGWLKCLSKLETLKLTSFGEISGEDLRNIPESLTSLKLSSCCLSSDAFSSIPSTLKKLNIYNIFYSWSGLESDRAFLFNIISTWKNLEQLTWKLSHSNLLESICSLTKLRTLCFGTDWLQNHVSVPKGLPTSITCMKIYPSNAGPDNPTIENGLPPYLRRLKMTGRKDITDSAISGLPCSLTDLDLDGCEGLTFECLSSLPVNLISLKIPVSPKGSVLYEHLSHLKALTSLSMPELSFSDGAIKQMKTLRPNVTISKSCSGRSELAMKKKPQK